MAAPVPSVATFLVSYPWFSAAPMSLVEKKLQDAATRTSATLWRDAAEQEMAVMLRAAVLLGKSPQARKARLVDDVMCDQWEVELYVMGRGAGTGLRVF